MISSDYIVWVVLDSVTTEIALHKIPVELRAKETNPLITRKKGQSPLFKLQKLLRIPDMFGYLFVVLIIMGIAWAVANYWVI